MGGWWRTAAALGAWLGGCHKDPDPVEVPDEGTGILGTGWANPFPSADQLGADGHLALRDLPVTPTPIPVERLAWRTGFSPVQVSVLRLDGIDPSGLPTFGALADPPGTVHSVEMVDLTARATVPCMAELDAYPGATERALLVRPLVALPLGHTVGVAVTTDAVARPERFDLLLSDTPPASLEAVAPAYRSLVADLASVLGRPADDIAVAWQFPIADGTAPLRSALDQLEVPGAHAFTRIRNLDAGDTVAPYTWRVAEGTFKAPEYLEGDRALVLDADGGVSKLGEVDAQLYVHLPTSVADAPAGSVPVLVFGHGLFGDPAYYLDDAADPSRLDQLADEAGFIVIATTWRGLTTNDRIVPIEVAQDFAQFHQLTDLLVQGQTNTRTLVEYAASGALFDDPVFQGASGQALVDPSQIFYYGISLGAIEGGVLIAQDPPAPIRAATLHVGGGGWSTMLERSSNWAAFELLISGAIPEPADRQVLYGLSQLWWDAVDPTSYAEALSGRSLLLQESIGDEQVPNVATELLARSIGLPVLSPTDHAPAGLDLVTGPLPAGSRALVQFDPELALPPVENRPAPVTGAHTTPRTWDGARLQVIDHLSPSAPGAIVHHCGVDPCSATHPGGAE